MNSIERSLNDQSRFIHKKSVTWRDLEGKLTCLDLETSEYFVFSSVARFIWLAINTGCSLLEVQQQVSLQYKIDTERARQDVISFATDLQNQGLIIQC
ncbi:MAG: PqqD family protein [Leptospiraceae bacterium]|nr:PqqD family protein [Leptospiraceae bacterium]